MALQKSPDPTLDQKSTTVGIPKPMPNSVYGSWTPVLTFGGGSTGMSYTSWGSSYATGPLTFCAFNITMTAKGTSTGTAYISGYPTLYNPLSTAFPAWENISLSSGYTTIAMSVGST